MTVEQIYKMTGSDFDGASLRMRKRTLMIRLLKLFPADPSMGELRTAVEQKDQAAAFRASHTLKGVALNLGFSRLGTETVILTDLLRGGTFAPGWEEAYGKVCAAYDEITNALKLLEE